MNLLSLDRLLCPEICEESLVSPAVADYPADEVNRDTMLLCNVPALPLLDNEGMGNRDDFVDFELAEPPLAILVARYALLKLDLLHLSAEQFGPLDDSLRMLLVLV